MHKKFVYIILVFFICLTGCQSIKDGLEGNKKTKSAEEFLIQKKKSSCSSSWLLKVTFTKK